jgi:NADH:ubiquinone oxidoreductase subunit 4 (subunit M)
VLLLLEAFMIGVFADRHLPVLRLFEAMLVPMYSSSGASACRAQYAA